MIRVTTVPIITELDKEGCSKNIEREMELASSFTS
jgi:hypothetical protein